MEDNNRWAGATEDSVYRVATQQGVFQPVATLRDQFAMAALTGLLSCEETSGGPDEFAEWSYEYADAMLAAREAK